MGSNYKVKSIKLNGRRMTSILCAHKYIKRKLNFPFYYGANLDALYDLLSTINYRLDIILFNTSYLYSNLDDYASLLIKVFNNASKNNQNVSFIEIK
jgi:ribonuclease inhibitor